MKFISKHRKAWLTCGIIGLVFAIVFGVAFPIVAQYETVINQFLNAKTFEVIRGEQTGDTEYFKSQYSTQEELSTHEKDLCAQVMAEGASLLLNKNNALPLKSGAKVSLFSQSSVRPIYGGTGSGQVDASKAETFKNSFAKVGLSVNARLWKFYESGDGASYVRSVPSTTESKTEDYAINEVPWKVYNKSVKSTFAEYGDAAIVVIARSGGEGCDLAINDGKDAKDGDYLKLNDDEREMMENLMNYRNDGTFKSLIVILNTSNMVSLEFLETYNVDACLWVGDLGLTGTDGVAQILSGQVNPSGRTVETYLKDNHSSPSFYNFGVNYWSNLDEYKGLLGDDPLGKSSYNNAYVVYQEGIYVGYRYYETRYTDYVMGTGNAGEFNYSEQVAFPFGTGLSYTEFAYTSFTKEETENELLFHVTVKNTGAVAGKHTVQIYLQSPYTDYDRENGIEKSAVALVGFDKTDLLDAGKEQELTITVNKRELAAYDSYNAKTYILDAGDYLFTIGANAHDAANNFLAKLGFTPADGKMDAPGNAELVLSYHVAELDTTTFSVSSYSGEVITNRFDDVDVLKYEGMDPELKASFKYLSRNDWMGTFPTGAVSMKVTDQMTKDGLYLGATSGSTADRNNDTYKQLVQKYIDIYLAEEGAISENPTLGANNGLTAPMMIGIGMESEEDIALWNAFMDQFTFDEMRKLVSQGFHNTVAVERDGIIGLPETKNENGPQGLTASLLGGFSSMSYTSADVLAATYNRNLAHDVGHCMGEDCLANGYNGMYAPGANIHRSPYSGRNFEYYSEDGFLSGEIAKVQCAGIAENGVTVQIKHLVLNDQETYRNGIATWANEQTIREIYLKAFEGAVADHGPLISVMTSFNRLGVVWAGAHRGLMTWVMDREWNVEGYNITDCSTTRDYMDGVLGLLAGTHLWDGSGEQAVASQLLYKGDPVVETAMKESAFRIVYSICHGNAMNGYSSGDRIVAVTPWYFTVMTGALVLFSVIAVAGFGLYITARIQNKKEK